MTTPTLLFSSHTTRSEPKAFFTRYNKPHLTMASMAWDNYKPCDNYKALAFRTGTHAKAAQLVIGIMRRLECIYGRRFINRLDRRRISIREAKRIASAIPPIAAKAVLLHEGELSFDQRLAWIMVATSNASRREVLERAPSTDLREIKSFRILAAWLKELGFNVGDLSLTDALEAIRTHMIESRLLPMVGGSWDRSQLKLPPRAEKPHGGATP